MNSSWQNQIIFDTLNQTLRISLFRNLPQLFIVPLETYLLYSFVWEPRLLKPTINYPSMDGSTPTSIC